MNLQGDYSMPDGTPLNPDADDRPYEGILDDRCPTVDKADWCYHVKTKHYKASQERIASRFTPVEHEVVQETSEQRQHRAVMEKRQQRLLETVEYDPESVLAALGMSDAYTCECTCNRRCCDV